MGAGMLVIGVALGELRRRARSAGRARPDLSLLGASRVAVVTAPPDTALPLPLPAPPAAARVAAPRRSPRQRLSALGTWLRQHGLLRHEAFVAYLASVLSIAAYAWYAHQGAILAYPDAIAHLSIARRVIAGRAAGLAQLGTVWPPLNHMLMLPLVWNDTLYRSGFAGALPSMMAFVVAAVYTYRTLTLLAASRAAGWAATLVLILNPNVLYMQATPMTEMDLICFAVISVYYIARWARTLDARDLVKGACATAAGTLVRYDGWALALALGAAIAAIAWRRRGRLFAESSTLLYAMLGFAGCAAWLIYEQVIFGNPLDFLDGPYSAKAQQSHLRDSGLLASYHHPLLALHLYVQTVVDNVSLPLCVLALVGGVWWAAANWRRVSSLPVAAVLVPFGFNWLSLVLGISVIHTPEIPTHGAAISFNVRYGMMMIPAAALFAGLLVGRLRLLLPAIAALAVAFGLLSTLLSAPYVLREPTVGNEVAHNITLQQAAFLAAHYQGGSILIGEGPFDSTIFFSGLPARDFLSDGAGPAFHAALRDPQDDATWIVMDPRATYDPVWSALGQRSDWRPDFTLVATIGTAQIYERTTPGMGGTASASGPAASQVAAGVSSALRAVADNQGFASGLAVSRVLAASLTAQPTTGGAT